jgi:glutamate dehydrogenase
VDLIWNGGIGTYIKASTESNLDVGDKANDSLRCNGNEIRASVIAEGGNLGLSQLGRIEYAKNGGRVNTDFIDNSAGVDCSDHEVNIKIALSSAMKSGLISLEERDKLLAEMTPEVEKLVLQDNLNQNLALTIAEHSLGYNIGMFGHLIRKLENEGLLNRKVEFLPSDKDLSKMVASKDNLTRPELAVLMSYSKMSIYNELLTSSIANDPASKDLLINYFPQMMHKKFKNEILAHPLNKEIIFTILTNKVINELGSPIINNIQSDTGAKLCDIIRSYMIVSQIFDINNLWKQAEDLSGKASLETQIDIFSEIIKLLRRGISWFVCNLPQPIEVAAAIEFYGESAKDLCNRLSEVLLGGAQMKLDARINIYKNNNINESLAKAIAILDYGVSALDILLVADSSKADKGKVAELYFKVADYFHIDWMRKSVEKEMTDSYWNKMSIQALKDDLYDKQRRIFAKSFGI